MNKKTNQIFSILEKFAAEIDRVANARIASCVVLKNDIVSFGTNQLKTHPFQALHARNEGSIYWHAETRAIHNALRLIDESTLQKCSLYVCRIDQAHNRCLAKPCEGCMKAIAKYRLKGLYFTG